MMKVLLALILPVIVCCASSNLVEQVHLSFAKDPNSMTVTWLTQKSLGKLSPYVKYGNSADALNEKVVGKTTEWTDQGSKQKTRFTHRVTIAGLELAKRYYYSAGSDDSMSQVFWFSLPDPDQPLHIAIFGDLAVGDDGQIYDVLTNATHDDDIDFVVHTGDIAYSLDDKNGDKGDDFMNAIEPIAAYVPYMVIAGNHEEPSNFNHYINRFTMPENGIYSDNQFWSIDVSGVHFVGISTEYYNFNMSTEAEAQFKWLTDDLQQNKARWTVLFMHRPMYCANTKKHGCQSEEHNITRYGAEGYPALEPLINSGGVDMTFWGHHHTYQRYYPVYNMNTYPEKDPAHFHNSPTTIYQLSGSAGCHDHSGPDTNILQPYTVNDLGEYGYSYVKIAENAISTLFKNGNISQAMDPFVLSKDMGYKTGQNL